MDKRDLCGVIALAGEGSAGNNTFGFIQWQHTLILPNYERKEGSEKVQLPSDDVIGQLRSELSAIHGTVQIFLECRVSDEVHGIWALMLLPLKWLNHPRFSGIVEDSVPKKLAKYQNVDSTATIGYGSGTPPLPTTGFKLDVGQSVSIPSVVGWSGRIWARTGCNFDANGTGKCTTGDCGGKLECSGSGAAPPTSLFEITLGRSSGDKDFYDVSLVDGYNLPIVAFPRGGGLVGACNATGCVADVNINCPKELQVMGEGEGEEERGGVVACKSACEAFGLDQYCCS
ncbi:unnamed protein product, partial [Eruca vesicaria subsp. sativa]|nr:unnamed protein product [Eruca vesicaria subsp. sativa]